MMFMKVSASKIELTVKADNWMTLGQAGIFGKGVIVARYTSNCTNQNINHAKIFNTGQNYKKNTEKGNNLSNL